MRTSNTLRSIAEGLKICGVGKDAILAILCLLKTPEQEKKLLEHLLSMDTPETEEQLLEKTVEITGQKENLQ